MARESEGIGEGARLYLAPSVKQILAPTPAVLEDSRPAAPASTCPTRRAARPWHRGPSYGRLNELFGVRHLLDVGRADPDRGRRSRNSPWARISANLPSGTTLRFAVAGNVHSRSFLPVEPTTAEVLAADSRGRPALLLRRVGQGSIVLCTYPVEHMAALTPGVNPDDTVTLYDALAVHAGVRRAITVDDRRVACDTLVRDDGARFAVIVSHADEPLTVKPVLPAGGRLTALDGTDATDSVTTEPFGVAILNVAH